MADQQSDTSKHMSRWGGGYVTAAQIIVEKFCEGYAEQERKVLTDQFWNEPEWKKFFILQIVHANKLLKTYPTSVVLAVVGSKDMRNKRVRSLGAGYLLKPLLDAEMRKNEPTTEIEINEDAPITLRQSTPKTNNIKSKLKGL